MKIIMKCIDIHNKSWVIYPEDVTSISRDIKTGMIIILLNNYEYVWTEYIQFKSL